MDLQEIHWDPSFSVGIEVLDRQHEQIIVMINQLGADSQTTVGSEMISELLTRLVSYISEHFRTEEALLEEYGYPGLDHQKEMHRMLNSKVVTFCQETMGHQQTVPERLLEFLREWWVSHILEEDMEYRPFLEARGLK